jgi:hypothetical protein
LLTMSENPHLCTLVFSSQDCVSTLTWRFYWTPK